MAAANWTDGNETDNERGDGEESDEEQGDDDKFAISEIVIAAGQERDLPETAADVRPREDEILMTDGPFVESKEQITGLREPS